MGSYTEVSHMPEGIAMNGFILVLTILGGISSIGYIIEKSVSGIFWAKRVRWLSKASLSKAKDVHIPEDVKEIVGFRYPHYRLPAEKDIEEIKKINGLAEDPSLQAEGNFLGNGTKGIALILIEKNGPNGMVVLVSRNEKELNVVEVISPFSGWKTFFIGKAEPGKYDSIWLNPIKKLRLIRDAINIGNYESSSLVLYWDKNRKTFKEFAISD